jgi:hypothetical protein
MNPLLAVTPYWHWPQNVPHIRHYMLSVVASFIFFWPKLSLFLIYILRAIYLTHPLDYYKCWSSSLCNLHFCFVFKSRIGYLEFSVIILSHFRKCRDGALNWATTVSFKILSNSLFNSQPIIPFLQDGPGSVANNMWSGGGGEKCWQHDCWLTVQLLNAIY